MGFTSWFHTLFDLLTTGDDGVSLLAASGGAIGATVSLFEADVTVEEALSYARVLLDLGQETQASELVREALFAAFGGQLTPAGALLRTVSPAIA
ncbi:MAG: hypothetical protein JRJ84_05600 [Deltaproteobacteria bacterium]|nr:hypothetical protein [Deltaproteobacteria bacterium]